MLEDVFFYRKHLSFIKGSLFFFFSEKSENILSRKSLLTRMSFPKTLRFVFFSGIKPIQFPMPKLLKNTYSSPHPPRPWQGSILPPLPASSGAASAGTAHLPPVTIWSEFASCRHRSQCEWLGKKCPLRSVWSKVSSPLSNPVKTNVSELGRSAAGRHCVLLQQEHTFHPGMPLLPHTAQWWPLWPEVPGEKSTSPFVCIACLNRVPQPRVPHLQVP